MGNYSSAINSNTAPVFDTPPNPHDWDQYVRFKILADLYVVGHFNVSGRVEWFVCFSSGRV